MLITLLILLFTVLHMFTVNYDIFNPLWSNNEKTNLNQTGFFLIPKDIIRFSSSNKWSTDNVPQWRSLPEHPGGILPFLGVDFWCWSAWVRMKQFYWNDRCNWRWYVYKTSKKNIFHVHEIYHPTHTHVKPKKKTICQKHRIRMFWIMCDCMFCGFFGLAVSMKDETQPSELCKLGVLISTCPVWPGAGSLIGQHHL